MTSATIGILTGIFGGLAWIKWATKKGVTNFVKDFNNIDEDTRTGLVSKENWESIGMETMSPVSLDTLCFQLSVVLVTAEAGCRLNTLGMGGINFLAFFCITVGIEKIGASRAAFVNMLEPVANMAISTMAYGTAPSLIGLCGSGLILCSVFLIAMDGRAPAKG